MNQVQHTQGIVLPVELTHPDSGDQEKWAQATNYQLAKLTQLFYKGRVNYKIRMQVTGLLLIN